MGPHAQVFFRVLTPLFRSVRCSLIFHPCDEMLRPRRAALTKVHAISPVLEAFGGIFRVPAPVQKTSLTCWIFHMVHHCTDDHPSDRFGSEESGENLRLSRFGLLTRCNRHPPWQSHSAYVVHDWSTLHTLQTGIGLDHSVVCGGVSIQIPY